MCFRASFNYEEFSEFSHRTTVRILLTRPNGTWMGMDLGMPVTLILITMVSRTRRYESYGFNEYPCTL